MRLLYCIVFFFSSRRRHTRYWRDWSSDVCSSDLALSIIGGAVITLMTWMQHTTSSSGLRLVPAVTTGFLLAGAQLNHAIVKDRESVVWGKRGELGGCRIL